MAVVALRENLPALEYLTHAETVLLPELANRIGLNAVLSEATHGLRKHRAGHDPGRVLVDVAIAIADDAVTISDV